jgi:hypothetical protein
MLGWCISRKLLTLDYPSEERTSRWIWSSSMADSSLLCFFGREAWLQVKLLASVSVITRFWIPFCDRLVILFCVLLEGLLLCVPSSSCSGFITININCFDRLMGRGHSSHFSIRSSAVPMDPGQVSFSKFQYPSLLRITWKTSLLLFPTSHRTQSHTSSR